MKRILCLCLVLLSLTCQAARQEDNIGQMIISLHNELMHKWKDIQQNRKANHLQLLQMDTLIQKCCDESKQCAMTIYSTHENSFQDFAFASQNSLTLYHDFAKKTAPYTSMLKKYEYAEHCQDSLKMVLASIDAKKLSPKAQKMQKEAILLIDRIQQYDSQVLKHLQSLKPEYNDAYTRLKKATETCQQKYDLIRTNMIYNFNNNILNIIADWDGYMERMEKGKELRWAIDDLDNAKEIATTLKDDGQLEKDGEMEGVSSWGAMRIFGVLVLLVLFIILSILISLAVCLVRWIVKKICIMKFWARIRLEDFSTRVLHGVTRLSGIKTFSLSAVWINFVAWICLLAATASTQGVDATDDPLAMEICFFCGVLAFLVTFFNLSYSGRQFWRSLAVCAPTLLASLYSLFSIIMVMPDDEIVVEVPFLTMAVFAIQWIVFRQCHRNLDDSMKRLSRLSLIFLGLAMVAALIGLQIVSTMVIVFWCSFMICIIILTSLKRYLSRIIERRHLAQKTIKYTWWISVLNRVLYPMAWIYSVLWSFRIACMVYSLDELLNQMLNTYFSTPIGNISINVSLLIFICWNILLATYLSRIIYLFVDDYHKSNGEENWKEVSFFNQGTIRTLVWGLAIINIMAKMGFSMQWLGYCMAGLSTGIGFASQETLENIIYGLTLRNGQLKIGDWIVCDGIRGQIKSIGLMSTRLDSVEGSVITYTNRQLSSMKYENITLNHGYELLHTLFSVNFGEDIEYLRKLLVDGYTQYECYDKERPVTLYCKKISDNGIDLDFRVWVLAADRIRLAAFNLEYVYKTLKENNIKYPCQSMEIINV